VVDAAGGIFGYTARFEMMVVSASAVAPVWQICLPSTYQVVPRRLAQWQVNPEVQTAVSNVRVDDIPQSTVAGIHQEPQTRSCIGSTHCARQAGGCHGSP
jgi:hypothetical protein